MSIFTRESEPRDAGFTLIELLVSILLFSMIFVTIGGLFMTLFRTHETVRESSWAANDSQLAATSIETGVRNSSNFAVTPLSGGDQLIVARTAGSASTVSWRCVAWHYSVADKVIRTTSGTTAIGTPSAAQLAGWTVLVGDIEPRSGTGVFLKSGDELVVAFDAIVDDAQPLAIELTVIPPVNDPLETSCF